MRKGERTKELILDGALRLASELGLEGLSLGKLAEEVEKGRLQAREAFVAQDALTEMLGQRIAAKREACLASVKLAALRGAPLDRGAR